MNTVTPSEIAAVQTVADDQNLSAQAAQQAQSLLGKAQQATAPEQSSENEPHTRQASVSTTTVPDAEAGAAALRFIALSRLRVSRRNVRKTSTAPLEPLAESIARVGLLQNLIVIADGDDYGVVGGRRRLAALRLLAKKSRLAKHQTIPCLVVPDESAVTVSLTENVQREAMHPADQFEAFKALVDEGRPIEDIAADFGVTPLVVQRRLKLARVSPRLLADYRADQVTLEQLMALAITDDHAAQETAYYEAPQWERDAIALRRRLTDTEVDASRSALAQFVGLDHYTAAGGGLRRDLFAEQDSGVYLTDADLLHRLATVKLETVAAQVKTEGWKWVDAMPTLAYSELSTFRRAAQVERDPNARERKRIVKLQAEQTRIEDALVVAEEAEDEDAAAPLYEQGDHVGQALDALYASLLAYTVQTMAQAGAIVTLDRNGDLVVHRGLVRPEDAKAAAQAQKAAAIGENSGDGVNPEDDDAEGNGDQPAKTVSEKLARNLSAHYTVALQRELAHKPDVALVALTHRLVLQVFYRGYGVQSMVQVDARQQGDLSRHAANLKDGTSVTEFDALRTAWHERLPVDADELFESLLAYKRADLLSLLAVCTAATLDAVTSSEHDRRADPLARALKLDMSAYWTASAENYFDHVSKGQILESFKVFKPGEINRVAGYKKAALAAEAGQYAVAAKWLPAMLTVAD